MQENTPDPFADDKAPALSFKDMPVGTAYVGTVTGLPKPVQSREFETGLPAVWPDGNPKMSVVINLDVDDEPRSLWAPKPSAMFAAIVAAQKAAGVRITLGGTLTVTYSGDKPNATNPRLNPAKQYTVVYVPPADDTDPGNGFKFVQDATPPPAGDAPF